MRGKTGAPATRDTIFALATAPGRAGVAVVRVSGPLAEEGIRHLTGRDAIPERKAVVRTLFDSSTNDRIDTGIVLFFREPHSYTGENIAEFQIHGGRAVQTALLSALGKLPGLRPAEAGEFTRRAVENGRLDLTQAEAIADLVAAETDVQRRQALRQHDGELSGLYEGWRSRLIRAAAWIEASIDFADEEIPGDAVAKSRKEIGDVCSEIIAHLNDGRRGEILRDGLQIAVIGPPNVGKSSLVNALARRDVAIVSEQPGTTRDVIEVHLDLGGYAVILADTAGLRHASDGVEQEGMRRARARAESADLRILVRDGTAADEGIFIPDLRDGDITVWNKADIAVRKTKPGLWVSARTGEGLADLVEVLSKEAGNRVSGGEGPILTRARYRYALEEAAESLGFIAPMVDPELSAEHVRRALRAIGRITGRVDLDELLDVVFRDFCIGK
jgi:tRNA modification GTPase